MGNTSRIAAQHYMRDQQVDFERATKAAASEMRTECAHSRPVSGRTREVSPDAKAVQAAQNAGKMPGTVLCGSDQDSPVDQAMTLKNQEFHGKKPTARQMRTLSGAVGVEKVNSDARLTRLIDAWPSLSDATREQIIAILDAAGQPEASQ